MVRVVVDTSVLVSALISDGKPRRLVFRLLEKHDVITSGRMLAELADVLSRGTFEVTDSQVEMFLSVLAGKSELVKVEQSPKVIQADPDDDVVLATAYRGKADYIVSGDKHLLDLKAYRATKVVDVNEMLGILRTKEGRRTSPSDRK
jgi:putative PIN family toxin of toxin-antitoxin system